MRGIRFPKLSALGLALGIALLSALLLAGQTPAQQAKSGGNKVGIKGSSFTNYAFHPKTLTVNQGATVKWSWHSNAPHNVTFRKLGKHSKTRANESYQLKFKSPGTYRYLCTVHGFKGKIVVK